jgi:hypothetical protein
MIFNGAQNALRDFLKSYNGGLLWTRNRLRRQFVGPDFKNSMKPDSPRIFDLLLAQNCTCSRTEPIDTGPRT